MRRRADVKVGFACNNKCLFCAQGDRRSQCGAVPLAELEKRLTVARTRAQGLVLTGGEPTVHRHLVTLVRFAKRLGFDPIQIQTNGRMLSYPGIISTLRRAGANEFSPSVHGSNAALHDSLTRSPGSFVQTTAGIRNVVASGARVLTNSVVVRQNVHDLGALITLLGSLGVRNAQLALVHPVGTASELFDEIVPRLAEVVEPLAQAGAVARILGIRLVTEAVPLCFLRDHGPLAVEASIPSTVVFDYDGASIDHSAWRAVEGKVHGPPCARCAARGRCEGPWREYPDRFGWTDFRPLP